MAAHARRLRTDQGPPAIGPAAILRAAGARLVLALLQWQELAQQRRKLLSMDDRMLKDIGLTRADAWREGMRPFWDTRGTEWPRWLCSAHASPWGRSELDLLYGARAMHDAHDLDARRRKPGRGSDSARPPMSGNRARFLAEGAQGEGCSRKAGIVPRSGRGDDRPRRDHPAR
jgi:uncharacterized protein YjiS (DUF1127 family)